MHSYLIQKLFTIKQEKGPATILVSLQYDFQVYYDYDSLKQFKMLHIREIKVENYFFKFFFAESGSGSISKLKDPKQCFTKAFFF